VSSEKRWTVERTAGEEHDVGAVRAEVTHGCLVFYGENDALVVAYAAGAWQEVWEQ
jgi:hypothetical protein